MLWSVAQLRIHLVWEKHATSAEGKTIRIAESSDMDSWEALLDHVLKFCKGVQVVEKFN